MKLKAYMTLSNLRDGALPQQDLCVVDAHGRQQLRPDAQRPRGARAASSAGATPRTAAATSSGPPTRGREALARAERAMESLEEEVLGALSTEDRDVLRGLLERAVAAEQAAV